MCRSVCLSFFSSSLVNIVESPIHPCSNMRQSFHVVVLERLEKGHTYIFVCVYLYGQFLSSPFFR